MMEAANLKQTTRNILLFEAILTASTVNHICVKPQQTKSPYELFYGKPPKLTVKHLIEFGRIGFVTIRNSIRRKVKPKSIKCIFVGYAPHHTSDTYKMYNPVTGKLILSRDIRWLDWVPYNPISTLPIDAQEPSDTHFLIPETPVHHPQADDDPNDHDAVDLGSRGERDAKKHDVQVLRKEDAPITKSRKIKQKDWKNKC